jgi:hypothetical protein
MQHPIRADIRVVLTLILLVEPFREAAKQSPSSSMMKVSLGLMEQLGEVIRQTERLDDQSAEIVQKIALTVRRFAELSR